MFVKAKATAELEGITFPEGRRLNLEIKKGSITGFIDRDLGDWVDLEKSIKYYEVHRNFVPDPI